MNDADRKKILKNSSTTSKKFSYSKGDVNLIFDLRTDIKQQLKDFYELLEIATKEVKKELEK